jgi:hypothetical protein
MEATAECSAPPVQDAMVVRIKPQPENRYPLLHNRLEAQTWDEHLSA